MPATITLADLSWATPDGRPLFSHLSLSFGAQRTGLVGRNGVGKSTLLALIAGDLRPQAGAVSVAGTLGVLRQGARLAPGETVSDLFGAAAGLDLLRRAEAGRATAEEVMAADWTLEARLAAALDRLGLDVTAETPLAALSGGQRTRAALAALVFAEPDFLLLDEPTNNLDADGRSTVAGLLGRLEGRRPGCQPRSRPAGGYGRHRRADVIGRHPLWRGMEPLPRPQGAGTGRRAS
ncbi:ATP-binding cassette domain-containing protein [Azospirillum sp. B4]|uniref:ATP-binding cassette domain-containing protein n=1 Tax=Azospirillum sp. B4 TaxID=95605 RepID=UPI00034626FC|nr:ATP-binding cassette domain-containing protein [Azospirillum sp. B4]